MKKTLYLLLAVLLLVSFSGCNAVKDEAEDVMPNVTEDFNDMNDSTVKDNNNDTILNDTPTGTVTTTDKTEEVKNENVSEYSKYSDTCYGFGFTRVAKGEIPPIGFYKNLMEGMNACYIGDTNSKNIYLTFDEGYENGYTAIILDTLKEKNVPAAFFCTGDYVTRNKELVGRMVDEGHIVGNHSWNHKSMPTLSDSEFKEELKKIDDYMKENFSYEVKYLRYPNGEFSERTLAMAKDLGYKTAFWSVAYKDWEAGVVNGIDYAVNQVTNHIHNGAVILLHAVSKDNADALGTIIDNLRDEGYTFLSLDQLTF